VWPVSLYYLDSCVLLKLVQPKPQTDALRKWRSGLDRDSSLVTSQLAGVEVARTFRRAGVDQQRVPFLVANALKGIDQIVLDDEVLTRAAAFEVQKLGTLDAIHLATAQPLAAELDGFLTYDGELMAAAKEIGLPHLAPT
jgi:predicted nucleic acid-binding protein